MPRRRDRKKKDKRQVVNLSHDEFTKLEKAAERAGISISGFLANAGLEKAAVLEASAKVPAVSRQ